MKAETITKLPNQAVFNFRFKDLDVNAADFNFLMGFEGGEIPEPFGQYINEVLDIAQTLEHISGSYVLFEKVILNNKENTTTINETVFNTGKIVTRQLRNSTSAALFVCTAGEELEIYSKKQMSIGNMPEGYIADMAGTLIVEAAMDKVQAHLEEEMAGLGMAITNRYSPGYCGWLVKEQQKLFSLLPGKPSNITLAESSLMHPIKSVSGIIGIGKDARFNHYTCGLCDMTECIYRNRNHH